MLSRFGPRHFASNQVYSPSLRATCRRVATRLGMADSLREGVYIQMAGPQFESVAELKMLKAIGVDAVGEACSSFRLPECRLPAPSSSCNIRSALIAKVNSLISSSP